MHLRRKERGTSLVEIGIVLPVLLLLAIGLSEIGFLVIDYITVANAARSGARTAAAAANNPQADEFILNVIEEDACNLNFSNLETITIYRAEADGSIPNVSSLVNKYENDGQFTDLDCDDASSHALTPVPFECCAWIGDGTPSGPRDRTPPDLDTIGVQVEFSHSSVTGLFPFPTVIWSEVAIMQIEPDTKGTQ